jgi:hypothetical protein
MARNTTPARNPPDADVGESHGPGNQEGDFEIEQNEEDGHQVVAHIELHAGVFESLEAAFVGGVFSGSGRLGPRM